MPHPPFLKDSLGQEVNFREYVEKNYLSDTSYMNQHYLDYLKYANQFCLEVIDCIIQKDSSAMVILMSDHGFRGVRPLHSPLLFDIQFYIRSPQPNVPRWPDTVDAVNVFRHLLTNQFHQQIKPLPYHCREFHETF
jgi:hypothetical protein